LQSLRLYANATQTVFAEGVANADLMLVGEQPGDREVIAGWLCRTYRKPGLP
jgi:uracil-DNA glycosylase